MGKKAREIAEKNVDVDKIVEHLKSAYADEWIAYYYYTYAAQNAEGKATQIIGQLKRIADEELEHAEELAERIGELGEEPPRNFDKLGEVANCPTVDLPKELSDVNGIAEAVIEGERCALDVYEKILEEIGSYDNEPSTYHLVRHIMDEEVEHEETFETILGK